MRHESDESRADAAQATRARRCTSESDTPHRHSLGDGGIPAGVLDGCGGAAELQGVSIPQSRTDVHPKQSVVVMVTKEALLVQGETVASLAEVSDPRTQLIEPLRKVLQRPIAGLDAAARDAALTSQEVTVMADKELPYEVLRKVLATCTAASYGKISLAVLQREKPVSGVKGR